MRLLPNVTFPGVGPGPWRRRAVTGPALSLLLSVALIGCSASDTASPASPETGTETPADPGTPPDGGTGDRAASTPSGADDVATSDLAGRIRPLPTATDLPAVDPGPVPVSISFPAIGLDGSPVDAVGVEPNGEMEVPSPRRVGWYEYGARPGQAGSTVLAAHIAADGVDGAFRRLAEAEVGDRLDVVMDDGSTVAYEVVEQAQYDKTQLPFDRVFSREGPDFVTLVTCGGTFQPSVGSYQDNVVVYAAPLDG